MKAETQIRIGQFTALIMLGFIGTFLQVLFLFMLISFVVREPPLFDWDLAFLVGVLALVYGIFACAVARGYTKICIGIYMLLYLDAFF